MIEIDGSQGEGGGQIVRSSLTLSAVTGQSCRIRQIRAGRKSPGLLRQHLTAVNAVAEVCDADVDGAQLGSSEIQFRPKSAKAGAYTFSVGTAGSATLVAQTLIPVLLRADQPSELTVTGGTHNAWAPTYDYLASVFLPILVQMGMRVDARIDRYGFYPAGGGSLTLGLHPVKEICGIELLGDQDNAKPTVRALVAGIPRTVGQRECKTIAQQTQWDASCFSVEEIDESEGPGNVVIIELKSACMTEMFTGFGMVGVRAERVAREALRGARQYLASGMPVGPNLADQLMLPLALAAADANQVSRIRTGPLTQHARTNCDVLKRFLDSQIEFHEGERGTVEIEFS